MTLANDLHALADRLARLRQKDPASNHCNGTVGGAFQVRAILVDRRFQKQNGKIKMSDGSWAELFPYVFFPFKIIVLGIGMFYAIKWHHDQAKKDEEAKRR